MSSRSDFESVVQAGNDNTMKAVKTSRRATADNSCVANFPVESTRERETAVELLFTGFSSNGDDKNENIKCPTCKNLEARRGGHTFYKETSIELLLSTSGPGCRPCMIIKSAATFFYRAPMELMSSAGFTQIELASDRLIREKTGDDWGKFYVMYGPLRCRISSGSQVLCEGQRKRGELYFEMHTEEGRYSKDYLDE